MISDDELVFLSRQGNAEAKRKLQIRYFKKQDRLIQKLLLENRYCGLEREDLLVIANKALDICIDSFSPNKNIFDAYYHLILTRELVNEMQKYSSPSQVILNVSMSLDAPIDNESGTALYEVVGHPEDIFNQFENAFYNKLNNLSDLEKQVLYYRSLDYNFKEIGEILKKNYRQISRIYYELVKKKGN